MKKYYVIKLACSIDQFGNLKFKILPRYKHSASFCNGIVTIELVSMPAIQAIGNYLGLSNIQTEIHWK